MGRNSTRLKINGEVLREILKEHNLNFSERAERYGVTKQALNSWLSEGLIPPRALVELVLDLKIPKEHLDNIIINSSPDIPSSKKKKWVITIEEN